MPRPLRRYRTLEGAAEAGLRRRDHAGADAGPDGDERSGADVAVLIELPESASGRGAPEVAREAASLAGDIILPRFRDNGARSPDKVAKGRGNFVTETDLACEEAVLALLRREYPGHRILSEETAERV